MEKIARFPGGEKGVESCHVFGCHGFFFFFFGMAGTPTKRSEKEKIRGSCDFLSTKGRKNNKPYPFCPQMTLCSSPKPLSFWDPELLFFRRGNLQGPGFLGMRSGWGSPNGKERNFKNGARKKVRIRAGRKQLTKLSVAENGPFGTPFLTQRIPPLVA